MQIISDIRYGEHEERGIGDLYLPEDAEGAPAALVIHGGGWNAMDKHGLAGVAELMCENGYGAFNINYRLLDHAPWPACGDDCVAAAKFLLAGKHPAMQTLDLSKIVIIGASAGGHLTLWTGLTLPSEKVKAMICIAGPADLLWRYENRGDRKELGKFWPKFFGTVKVTDEMFAAASPINLVDEKSSKLLCVHSTNDRLVLLEHSQMMIDKYEQVGADAQMFTYPGPGEQHGIWIEGTDPHRLLKEPSGAIVKFLKQL